MEDTPAEAWRDGQGRVVSGIWPLADLSFRRWREVEVHHVDRGLGYGVSDWPEEYVVEELAPECRRTSGPAGPGNRRRAEGGRHARALADPRGNGDRALFGHR